MSQPLLSIGMIVKNEERCLEKCLKALEPLRQAIPCELVIADTGSTDKTKEIAARYADILFDFKWVNDFSKARNAVMDRCTGKWYLTLDADEYLVSDIAELVNFLKSKASDKMKEATIIQRNHFAKNMDGKYSDFNAKRLCRMNTGARYTGTIHEYFNIPVSYDEIYILNNTILDHDGYAHVTPEHKAQKELRNLELLEENLKKEPDNIRTILQCLESSAVNAKNRRYYTKYAIEKLQAATPADDFWTTLAPNCAKQVALYLSHDNDPALEEWFEWTFKTFPNSEHTIIDVKYLYTKFLFSQGKYPECIKVGKEYLKSLSDRKKQDNVATLEKVYISLLHAHEYHKNEIQIIIADAMINENRESEAIKVLTETKLYKQDNKIIDNWFVAVTHLKQNEKACDLISKHLTSTLNKYAEAKNDTYDFILTKISAIFSAAASSETKLYHFFSKIPGTIGLSVKIADSKTKEEAESFLNKIENWEEFMPLALKQTLLLKAELPEEFYSISASRLSQLTNDLCKSAAESGEALVDYFGDTDTSEEFPRTSFIFNLLLTILFNCEISLTDEFRLKCINRFSVIADDYLTTCYNPNLLKNEKYVSCIPATHLFAWYLVKATKEKEQNPLEYIKTLRTALNKVPQAKQTVEFLIEEFKKEEEQKRQEQIKNAAPELIAMAQQLKTMLGAFPENSPELLAIKQSPMYKQVAFLIEE